jgi:hypothetical protein
VTVRETTTRRTREQEPETETETIEHLFYIYIYYSLHFIHCVFYFGGSKEGGGAVERSRYQSNAITRDETLVLNDDDRKQVGASPRVNRSENRGREGGKGKGGE